MLISCSVAPQVVEPVYNERERSSGLGILLIHGGMIYIPEPEVIYQMKQN